MPGDRLYPGVAAGGYWRLAAVSASLAPPSATQPSLAPPLSPSDSTQHQAWSHQPASYAVFSNISIIIFIITFEYCY